jgi:hypothetical protein
VGNRCAIRALGPGPFYVDVNPLVVDGDIGELVDAILVDHEPAADTQFGTDQCDRLVD